MRGSKKISVAVLMGGKTPEHEISLITGREVVRHLSESKYKVLPVVISRNGNKWQQVTTKRLLTLPDPLKLRETNRDLLLTSEGEIQNIKQISKKLDVVFIAMHGPFGEDGTVQGMLELAGIAYIGPGVLASALAMDKVMFRKVMLSERIPIPKYVVVKKGEPKLKVFRVLGSPSYFVKPHNQGSSVGSSIVKTKKDLNEALNLAYQYSETALVDEYLEGKEITCGVLGNKHPTPLPLVEIIPKKGEFFDYDSKYTESGAEEIVPARIPKRLERKVQQIAVDVYNAIGCRGFSRVDFIVRDNNQPVVLEVNTIPGLTPMSLMPKAAMAIGLSYPKLIDRIIEYALE
jgi:D-alanine-D-alanine ligase